MKKKTKLLLICLLGLSIILCSSIQYIDAGYSIGYEGCITAVESIEYAELGEEATDYETIIERIAQSSRDYEEYMTYERYLEGEIECFDVEYEDWGIYYRTCYCLVQGNSFLGYYYDGDTIYELDTTETIEGRKEVISKVLETFEIENSGNSFLTVMKVVKQIRETISYDQDYKNAYLLDAIEEGKGVCVHYASLTAILLNSLGIPCRTVTGTYAEGSHAWNEVYIDGSWYTVDACNSSTGFIFNTINYEKSEGFIFAEKR